MLNGRNEKSLKIFFCKSISIIILLFLLVAVFCLITPSFATPQSTKSIDIFSNNPNYKNNEPGSWKITKTSKWVSKDTVEVKMDVDTVLKKSDKNVDVIIALDEFQFLGEEKSKGLKEDVSDFSSSSQVLSSLTDNKEDLLGKVSSLKNEGTTSYYRALINVENILESYVKEDERECIVLMIMGGYSFNDSPYEEIEYKYLKEKYPFVIFNGIQYEMGNTVLEEIEKASDNYFVTDSSSLNSILFDVSLASEAYSIFRINDYIDANNFSIQSDGIKVSKGSITIDENDHCVNWNIAGLKSKTSATLTMKMKLKNELTNVAGLYSTGLKSIVKSEISDIEDYIEREETISLLNNSKVVYDGNMPTDCSLNEIPEGKNYFVFDTVEISENIPKCNGYQFKGWEIITDGVSKINDDYFTMPGEDVILRGVWSKVQVSKLMNGKVSELRTLYKQVEKEAKKYTGNSSTFKGNKNVYYYYGDTDNNKVLFAGFCWRIVRTTDTGGVKLIYYGIPDSSGWCTGVGTTIGKEYFNSYWDSGNAHVGYMYGDKDGTTYDVVHANKNNSTIKKGIDDWFKNNMLKYKDYLEGTVWCNDRSLSSGTGIGKTTTYYSAYKRLYENGNKADLTCQNDNDKFTVNSENGNGALTYPIALITADELILTYDASRHTYSIGGDVSYFWTMTPARGTLSGGYIYTFEGSQLSFNTRALDSSSIRPAISLQSEIEYSSGDGSAQKPYVILTD